MKRKKLYAFIVYGTCVGCILYYYTSLAFYQPQDPAFNSISEPPFPITNPMGRLGANISAVAFYYLGGGAFLLPFLVYSLFSLFFLRSLVHFYRSCLTLILISASCCLAEKTLQEVFFAQYPIRAGGFYGYAGIQFMRGHLSPFWFWFTLLAGALGSLFLYIISLEKYLPLPSLKWVLFSKIFSSKSTAPLPLDFLSAYSEKMIPMLKKGKKVDLKEQERFCLQIKETMLKTFRDFHITGTISEYVIGPVVTVFEFRPTDGTKQAKVLSISDEIALALKADAVLISPISAKQALGIQVPNRLRENVLLGDLMHVCHFFLENRSLEKFWSKT